MFDIKKIVIFVAIVSALFFGIKSLTNVVDIKDTDSFLATEFSKFVDSGSKSSSKSTSKFGLSGGGSTLGNPSYANCTDLGYKIEGDDCVFPNGSKCELWSFVTGECGQAFTFCGRNGFKTGVGDGGSISPKQAVCVFADGESSDRNFAKVWPFFEGLNLYKRTKDVCLIKVPNTVDLTAIEVHPNPIVGSEYTEIHLPNGFCFDSYPSGAEGYYIVQLDGFMHQDRKEEIELLGGVIYDSVPQHAFVVKMNEKTRNKVNDLQFVEWVGIYHPVYKMKPSLVDVVFMKEPTLTVTVFEDENIEDIVNKISSLGGTEMNISGLEIETKIGLFKILSIAKITGVKSIKK